MIVDKNYACAYTEVIEILKYTKREDVNKIPKYKILLYKNFMDKEYEFKVDVNKTIEEQNLSIEAKAILANIFKNYWATDYQKQRIEAKEKYDLEQIEKEKNEKYNPEDLFKNRKKVTDSNTVCESEETALIEYKKENFFIKILNKIKSLWKK